VKRKAEDLAASLRRLGPAAAVDMDDAGMRFTLDVVALVRRPASSPMQHVCLDPGLCATGAPPAQAGFGYDFQAVRLEANRVLLVLPRALEEIQRRMTNPLQVFAWTQVRCHLPTQCEKHRLPPDRWRLPRQEAREGIRCAREFRGTCADLLVHLRQAAAAGRLDKHIGAALLAVRDATGSVGSAQCCRCNVHLQSSLCMPCTRRTFCPAQVSRCPMRA